MRSYLVAQPCLAPRFCYYFYKRPPSHLHTSLYIRLPAKASVAFPTDANKGVLRALGCRELICQRERLFWQRLSCCTLACCWFVALACGDNSAHCCWLLKPSAVRDITQDQASIGGQGEVQAEGQSMRPECHICVHNLMMPIVTETDGWTQTNIDNHWMRKPWHNQPKTLLKHRSNHLAVRWSGFTYV